MYGTYCLVKVHFGKKKTICLLMHVKLLSGMVLCAGLNDADSQMSGL